MKGIAERMDAVHTRDMNTETIATAAVANMETAQLMLMHGLLEDLAVRTEEDKIMRAAIAETIEERHNLTAALEAICEDVDFEGTYHDALVAALAQVGA